MPTLKIDPKLFKTLILVFGAVIFFDENGYAVPAMPNEGIITGRVVECELVSEGADKVKKTYAIKIFVESSEDVENKRNFARDAVGKTIVVYTKDDINEEITGKGIKGRIRYQGDERGGKYWMWEIEILTDTDIKEDEK